MSEPFERKYDVTYMLCYAALMTKEQIEAILERVRTWPDDRLEDVAAVLLEMEAANEQIEELTDEDWADLEQGLAEADRGEFASDEEVKVLFDRYR